MRTSVRSRCAPADGTATVESSKDAVSENGASGKPSGGVPTILEYKEGGVQSSFATSSKLAMAIPWRRVKKGSFMSLKLEGMYCVVQYTQTKLHDKHRTHELMHPAVNHLHSAGP